MALLGRLRQRAASIATALVMVIAGLSPVVLHGTAGAAIVDSRYIKMSSSAVSAASTSYEISWKSGSTTNFKSVAIDFCANSPIVGDSCTATVGTSTPSLGTPVVTGSGVGAWTESTVNTGRTLVVSDATGITPAVNDVQTMTLTSATNPSALGTFFARILTFPNASGTNSAANYTAGTPGAYIDYGGVALSTANQLTITAKVQESLTFCVYATFSTNCAGSSGTAVTVGDSNGILSPTSVLTDLESPGFGLSSNAAHGVIVRMKGSTLTSGSNTIDPFGGGSGACTADSVSTSVEQFGMRATTTSPITVDPGYACSSGNHSLDTTNIATTYGDTLASTAGALDETHVPMEFAAKSATATEAGIYTATFTFIATGTY
jgi:hypothetical protein